MTGRARTLQDWTAALRASGATLRRDGAGWRFAPCPGCGGGSRDRGWLRPGRRAAVTAGCNGGCTFEVLARALFPARRGPNGRAAWRAGRWIDPETPRGRAARNATGPRKRPLAAPERAGDGPDRRPVPAPRTRPGAIYGPLTAVSGDSRPRSGAESGAAKAPRGVAHPGTGDPGAVARALWARSEAIPTDPAHPARRWAKRRNLWPDRAPWPDAIRWHGPTFGAIRAGGSLVCAFAPLPDWLAADRVPAPSGVQCVHVDPEGRPRKDRGGLGKRSHGSMGGAVCVVSLADGAIPGRLHVVEGVADALAVAARTGETALAAGGTAGFGRLADPLAALSVPVTVWPDGDTPGRLAASRLALALEGRGVPAHLAPIPDGEDPASMAAPRNKWRHPE